MTSPPSPSAAGSSTVAPSATDPAEFSRLVDEHHGRVCHFLHRYTRNRQDAEDLTQDTFLKAYRNLHRFDPTQGSFTSWLYTIARRTLYNHYRDHRPTETLDFEVESGGAAPDAQAAQADQDHAIWTVVRQLKSPYREVVLLKYADDLSIAEIARILNRTQTGVKILLFRARGQLRRLGLPGHP